MENDKLGNRGGYLWGAKNKFKYHIIYLVMKLVWQITSLQNMTMFYCYFHGHFYKN